jgi:hypothetical protein
VTALLTALPRPGSAEVAFAFRWVTPDGVDERVELGDAWSVPFEEGRPVRRFPSRKGQRHLSGLWWSATTGAHVGFESWLERDHVMLLDFDASVVDIASQPFWLSWLDEAGSTVTHCPDYFARRTGDSAVVIDCRPVERRPATDAAKFDATAAACAELGWEYRLVGAADPVVLANVRWLAGYRHPRHEQAEVRAALREVFGAPTPLMDGAGTVGDPVAVLPGLFHLLWRGELVCDLNIPMRAATVVRLVDAR